MYGMTVPKLQRARGKIGLHLNGQKLEHLYQSGCAKLMLPKTYGNMSEAVMLNTAGGVTRGGRGGVRIKKQKPPLVVKKQKAEKRKQKSKETTNTYR